MTRDVRAASLARPWTDGGHECYLKYFNFLTRALRPAAVRTLLYA